MADALRAYSLGYEGMSLDRYVEVLKDHGISVVIDVRETPWSYKRGFSKKPLAERLSSEGILYVHLKSAGNPSRNRKMGLPQHKVIALYKKHLEINPSCLSEIFHLITEASHVGGACLLCFEQKPHECHRKVILDKLAGQNCELTICHLQDCDKASEEPVTPKRIPKSNDGKRSRMHVEVAQEKRRPVSV
jgi:uncharacterized protein (DUF488 family)